MNEDCSECEIKIPQKLELTATKLPSTEKWSIPKKFSAILKLATRDYK